MPPGRQLSDQRLAGQPRLHLGAGIAAAEVGQAGSLLRVELPIQQADQRLVHVADDLRAAG
ncbi:hypothetical protein D3C86_2163880 [compost metagenome]